MSHLTDMEATVLQMRFGIGDDNRLTLREMETFLDSLGKNSPDTK